MKKPVNILAFSDTHTGHHKTPTAHTVGLLWNMVPDTDETGKLDMIFIPGDFFDKLFQLNSPSTYLVIRWIHEFLQMCSRRDIIVRILEGTPSHDRGQAKLFITIADMLDCVVDVKYFNTLQIEHIDKFDIDVLYVPDEWRSDPDITWKEVKHALKVAGLKWVDFALMHGMIEQQLPPNLNLPIHNADRYCSIVRYYIFMGHVHQMLRWKKFIIPGSTNRLTHGDEGSKGYFKLTVNPNGLDKITFIVNKDAYLYMTIDCSGMDILDAHKHINKIVRTLQEGNCRVLCGRDDPMARAVQYLKDKHPHIVWSSKIIADKLAGIDNAIRIDVTYSSISLTPDNLVEQIRERIPADVCNLRKDRSLKLLQDAINARI